MLLQYAPMREWRLSFALICKIIANMHDQTPLIRVGFSFVLTNTSGKNTPQQNRPGADDNPLIGEICNECRGGQ
jgi:hypothetical protein